MKADTSRAPSPEGVTLAAEKDVLAHTADVSFLRAEALVLDNS